GFSKQLIETRKTNACAAILPGELHIGVGDQYAAAECPQKPHHPRANRAIADDAHGQFAQFPSGAVGAVEVSAPFATSHRLVTQADEPRLAQYGAYRELGHRAGIAAWHVDDPDAALPDSLHIYVDGPAARHGNHSEARKPAKHGGRHWRQMRYQYLRVADEIYHVVAAAKLFLPAVHARHGITMLHRLIRPGILPQPDVVPAAAGLLDLGPEDLRQHETIADDRNPARRHGRSRTVWPFPCRAAASERHTGCNPLRAAT